MGIGVKLRTAREQKGYKLADLADFLRIQETYLAAIEADDFQPLLKSLGSTYVNGFIRSYARQLELDPDQAVAEFQREQVESTNMPPLVVRQPIEEHRLPSWRLIAAAIGGLLLVVLGWNYFHADHAQIAETVPPVPDRYVAAAPTVVPAPAQQNRPQPAATGESEDSDEATDVPEKTYSVQQVAPPSAKITIATAGATLGENGPSRVAVHAVDNSWVQIHDGAGAAVFTGILHAGETYRVPDQPGYTMVAGNAGGIQLSVDDVLRPALGETGQVVHNVALDAGKITGR